MRALLVLGLHFGGEVVPIQMISEEQNIPKRFLEQILNDLKVTGAVESKRGIAGGYRLARAPQEISLASIIRHVEGALAPISCVSERFYEKCSCPDEARCAIRNVMKDVRSKILEVMGTITVADLCARAQKLAEEPATALDYVI